MRWSIQFIKTFQLYDFLDTLISLFVAFVFGTLIGAERQYGNAAQGYAPMSWWQLAPPRLSILLSALRVPTAQCGWVIAYVVSGIGFSGAGAIMKEGMNVRGLNTAATLWASAAVGACAGADMVAQSAAATIFVLAGNTLLRPLVNAIDRIPLNEGASEATYEIIVTTNSERAAEVREKLAETLEKASYPIRETKVIYRSDDNVEVAAELVTLAAEPDELDGVVAALAALPGVSHAAWNVSAME
jgi:putative Mg2+ transporter-C (MgtC) family protein